MVAITVAYAVLFDALVASRHDLLKFDARTGVSTADPHGCTLQYLVDRGAYSRSKATVCYDVTGLGRVYNQWPLPEEVFGVTAYLFECCRPHSADEINDATLFPERLRSMDNCMILALPARADGTIAHITIFKRQFLEGFLFQTGKTSEDLIGLFHLTVYAAPEKDERGRTTYTKDCSSYFRLTKSSARPRWATRSRTRSRTAASTRP